MRHTLVIGGSGMLAKASCWLANHYDRVSVVGRSQHKFNRITKRNNNIIPILVDYYDQEQFRAQVRQSIADYGPYELVVAWIHSHENQIIDIISEEIDMGSNDPWCLYHVLGSSSSLDEIAREMKVAKSCEYHQVQLGFIIDNDRSRWLTHEEISDGVIHAIQSQASKYLVGTLTPWSKRP